MVRSIRKVAILALVLCVSRVGPADAHQSDPPPSVLFVLSSEGKDAGATRPGFEMDELAQAWAIFRDNGLRTTIASPRGGPVEADKYNPADPDNARLLADPDAMAMLRGSAALSTLVATDFDAIYVIGGKGAMFDLATDRTLARLIGEIHERGGVVAAICHGSAALAGVRLADGRYLAEGRAVTGFSAEEEALFGKQWAARFPFQLEDTLRRRGGRWVESAPMMPGVAIDGRLVTGQNPYSTGLVADAVLRALGVVPAERLARKDEASLRLIERVIAGDGSARHELAASPQQFQPELIAIVGHYQLQGARHPEAIRAALAAMDLAAPHFDAPQLSVSRSDAMYRLGQQEAARQVLAEVLAANPDMPEALALRKKFSEAQ